MFAWWKTERDAIDLLRVLMSERLMLENLIKQSDIDLSW